MSFLDSIVADLKTSATKAVANVYTANLDKAQQAASKLFTTMKTGEGVDLKNQTMPAAAVPQNIGTNQPSTAPSSYTGPVVIVAALAALVFFFKRD